MIMNQTLELGLISFLGSKNILKQHFFMLLLQTLQFLSQIQYILGDLHGEASSV